MMTPKGIFLGPAGKRLGSRIPEIDTAQSIGGDNGSGPRPEQASHPIVLPLDLRLQLVTLRNVEQAGPDHRYLSGSVFDQGTVHAAELTYEHFDRLLAGKFLDDPGADRLAMLGRDKFPREIID
jgi:hypothetical protein